MNILYGIIMIYAIALAAISVIILLLDHLEVMRISRKRLIIFIILAISIISFTYMIEFQQEQKEKATSMEGVLESDQTNPPSTILFSTKDNISAMLQLGTSDSRLIWTGPNGKPMLVLPKDQYIAISKDQGELKLSAKLIGRNGLMVEIIDNEWKINPQESWDRNYNYNTLEVKDENGNVVLQVRLLYDRIQLQFISPMTNNALLGAEGIDYLFTRNPTTGKYEAKIIPLFKYPSKNHFGELGLVREIKK